MNGFVGVQHILSCKEKAEERKEEITKKLVDLLNKLSNEQSYYFVRSPHSVSGITRKRPVDFARFEGQMFNADRELRWKKQKDGYNVLLLSRVEADLDLNFEVASNNWEISDRNAYFHEIDETKFPKDFIYRGENDEDIKPEDIPIAQRYFKDKDTATVHFVALTIQEK